MRTKITLLCAIMVVATMVVATAYGISAIRDMGNSSANETLKLLCETGQKNLDNYFGSVEQSVEMVGAYIESDLDGIDDTHLQAHLDRVNEICDRLMSKNDGVLTYYYRIDPTVSTNVTIDNAESYATLPLTSTLTPANTTETSVTGKDDFTGTETVKPMIKKTAIKVAKAAKIKPRKYTGKAIKPVPKLTYKGKKLKKGRDYKVSYKNNVKRGTAKIVITGKGNFKGKKVVKFKIR